ncbi:hypothetical protein JRO89_XS03G0082200 [Xanthoceras sorbifolium]|uniref:CCHC-type domain-containing protein n=1 Tax=Xanthoceras sorbifolium TaxID=99658 RepID=A0ABQ8I955_9ROSI|nr:hypothetical protein JRO89_XS03G0082200 [Xanthoceras sorbifolium]
METPRRVGQRGVGRPAREGRTGIGRGAGVARGDGGGNRTQLQVVEQFRRLHPPSFEGTANLLDAEEWLRELEKMFSFMNCTENQKVACLVFMLKGGAGHWFKELFNQKYFPKELRKEKESEFIQLTQGTKSLVEYERKFEQLSRFILHLIETEQYKINHLVGGLKPDIRKHVRILGLRTYAEVLQKAQILAREDELARDEDANKEHPVCDTCGKKHGGVCFKKIGTCFKCGKSGDYIHNCPKLKKGQGAPKKDQKTQGRVYAFTKQEAEASPSVVSGECLCAKELLRSCRVQIEDKVLEADLIILDMRDFDIIFCMD